MGNFGDVREALMVSDGAQAWTRLQQELDPWYGREPFEVVMQYCLDHLNRWPEDMPTFAPASWFKRDPATIAADPLTPLFVHATTGRTGHWRAWAEATLLEHKALKPPKFLDLAALGEMKWRTGEALREDQAKRLIVFMRAHKQAGAQDLERMRQLLDDADCQRWSRVIHRAWVEAGEESAHRWALFQIAAMGNAQDLDFTGEQLSDMVYQWRHTRAKQYMEIAAAMQARDALSAVGQFALYGALSPSTRSYAIELLLPLAEARGRSLFSYLESMLEVHGPWDWSERAWADPTNAASLAHEDQTLSQELEHAMRIQRGFPWWRLRAHAPVLALQPGVLWRADAGPIVRFDPDAGPVDAAGVAVELRDDTSLRIVHPANMTSDARGRWQRTLDEMDARPPFAQLDRPIFLKSRQPFFTPGQPLPIHPSILFEPNSHWLPGHHNLDTDRLQSHLYRIPGAPWYLEVEHENYYSPHGSTYGGDYDLCIEGYKLRAVIPIRRSLYTNKVVFSEAQLAIQALKTRSDAMASEPR